MRHVGTWLLSLVIASGAVAETPASLDVRLTNTFAVDAQYILGTELNPVHNRQLLTFDNGGLVKAFDMRNNVELWRQQVAEPSTLSYQTAYSTTFSPTGRFVAVSNHYAKFAKLLNAATGDYVRDLELPTTGFKGCRTLAFSPDERYLACGDWNKFQILIWETETGRLTQTLSGAQNIQWDIKFSADQRLLYQIGFNYVMVWDLTTGERINRIAPPRTTPLSRVGVIKGGVITPDGRFAVLSVFNYDSSDRPEYGLSVVNLETGVPVRTFKVPGRAFAMALAGDELRVLLPRRLRIYDVRLDTLTHDQAVPILFDTFLVPTFPPDDDDEESELERDEIPVDDFLWIADTAIPVRFAPDFDFFYTPVNGGRIRTWEVSR